MRCRINDCTKEQLSGRPFCCKEHWAKIPKKIKRELNTQFDAGDGAITVESFERIIIQANFAIKVPGKWEARAEFYFKNKKKKAKEERVLIVHGYKLAKLKRNLWAKFCSLAVDVDIYPELEFVRSFDDTPYSIAIVLGEAGFKKLLPRDKVKNGITHMGNKVATAEKYFNSMWAHRPAKGTYMDSKYIISCEPHPEEYDSFEEAEIAEIRRCLQWASTLYKSKLKSGI